MRRTTFLFLTLLATATAQTALPSTLLGHWVVGAPYDVKQPIGVNATQEAKLKGLPIVITRDEIAVCGQTVPVKSVAVDVLTPEQFLARYNFTPDRIGLRGPHITDVSLNELHSTNACGEFNDPGTHMLASGNATVMEVGNDYFRLRKSRHR